MQLSARQLVILAVSALGLVTAIPAFAGGGPQNVLVVVNGDDPDSIRIGEHYVKARGVPPGHLLRLGAPKSLTTDFATYRKTIQEPIKTYLARTGIGAHVDYIVLTRGLPILTKVPGGSASVAACLMVMDTPLSGQRQKMPMPGQKDLKNPFVGTPRAFSHAEKYGDHHLYLATMLTGYTAEDSIALVDRAIAAERAGPPVDPLYIFQDAAGNAGVRNRFYAQAMDRLKGAGRRVEHYKNGAKLVVGKKRIIGYMSGGSYSQLTLEGIGSNEYLPGAICDMLESYGAVPQNFDPKKKSQVPVTWFVKHGITGVHGAVAEPYAHTFPDVLLFERYAAGMNLAEAFHASIPFLYWKNLVIGDPLCTPFVSRPVVTITGAPGKSCAGTIELAVSAKGGDVRGLRLFVDGRIADRAKGGDGEFTIDTTKLTDGPHHVLAAAVLPPPLKVQGWATTTIDVRNPDVVPIAATAGPKGAILVQTSRPVDPGAVTAKIGGRAAKVERWIEAGRLKLTPGEPLPAGREITIEVAGAAVGAVPHTVAPFRFVVEGPATATAGEEIEIRIRAVDAEGKTAVAYRGRVTVALESPSVDAASVAPKTPEFGARLRLQRAGDSKVRVFDRVTGVSGELTVKTSHGAPAGFRAAPASCPRGVPFDLEVRLFDRYGNAATGYSGRVMLAFPTDFSATVPTDADAKDGVAVFPGVIVTKTGPQIAVVRSASGDTLGRGTLRITDFTERKWLVTGPRPEKFADAAGVSPSEGHVIDGAFWRRYESPKNEIDLKRALGGGKGFSYAALHVFVPSAGATRITLGWGSRVTLFVDGKPVFEAKKAEKKVKADRHVMRGLTMSKGWHRILVMSEHGGASDRFVFRITDDEGAPIRGLKTALSAPGVVGMIEGRITAAGAGVSGMELQLTGPANVRTRTLADGRFRVGGLPAGKWVVTPLAKGLVATPGTREVVVSAEPVKGVDFDVKDEIAPEVSIESPTDGAKGGDTLEVVVTAADNVKVTEVWLSHDGARIGDVLKKAPWKFTVTAKSIGYRSLKLTAFATDAAGNQSESKPVRVRLIRDRKGPTIRVKWPKGTKPITAKTNFQAEVTDEIAVAEVEFHVDGKQIGKALTAPRTGVLYEAPFDPKSVKKGVHTLVIKARDPAGNESKKTVKFKTK